MTTPEDLIEYMLVECISGLDFISNRLVNAKSRQDIRNIGELLVPEALLAFGYRTTLKYEKISNPYWAKLSTPEIFRIQVDQLFGEQVTFNIDLYRQTATKLQDKSNSHKIVKQLIEDFGRGGFQRALKTVASSHKWEAVGLGADGSSNDENILHDTHRKVSLNQKEISEIIEDLEKIKVRVDDLNLSQQDRSQVLALASAAIYLAESPNPPWKIIKEIIYLIAAIATSLGFVLAIAEKIV